MSYVRVYDIEACHYTILKNKGFDLSQINPEDKLGRNIAIGQLMKDNPKISLLLRTTTESIINDYINVNNIKDDEIVIRQYDGLLLTRKLDVTNLGHIPLDHRETLYNFISSINRNSYIALNQDGKLKVKGVAHQYDAMNEIYRDICKSLDLLSKDSIFPRLQQIKDEFFTTDDAGLFGIPTKENKYNIFLKGYGELEVSKSTLKIMDTNDVDREKYFRHYIDPFTKSMVVELWN